jgi:hypothetical protein
MSILISLGENFVKVIVLQCFFRKLKATREVQKKRERRDKKIRNEEAMRKRQKEVAEKQRKYEIERRIHPKTLRDFALLYSGLESTFSCEHYSKCNFSEVFQFMTIYVEFRLENARESKSQRIKHYGAGKA